jgi:hypothetical protein
MMTRCPTATAGGRLLLARKQIHLGAVFGDEDVTTTTGLCGAFTDFARIFVAAAAPASKSLTFNQT